MQVFFLMIPARGPDVTGFILVTLPEPVIHCG